MGLDEGWGGAFGLGWTVRVRAVGHHGHAHWWYGTAKLSPTQMESEMWEGLSVAMNVLLVVCTVDRVCSR